MRNKPDDRSDNVEKIQRNISNTIQNIHRAEEMIEITDDDKTRQTLIEKNERRDEALNSLRKEIKDEAIAREVGITSKR